MALHLVVDPPALFARWHALLEVDGIAVFSCLGPGTLRELRDLYRDQGWPAPTPGYIDMHDLGDMLVAAGFSAPVMDAERLTFLYDDADRLLADLRATGQTCARLSAPRHGLAGRRFVAELKAALNAGRRDGKLSVSYEVVYGHAWKGAPRKSADGRSIVQFARRP
jgi:malonyl-CoA O-methyltransferase